jgi:hypothetical protein
MTAMAVERTGPEIKGTPEISAPRQWAGKIFLVLALAWFGLIFYIQRPDQPHIQPRPTPVVMMDDGKWHEVYLPYDDQGAKWIEGVDIRTQYTAWDFMRRPIIHFLIVAVGPIFAALMGALIYLGVAEWRVRRRNPVVNDSLF